MSLYFSLNKVNLMLINNPTPAKGKCPTIVYPFLLFIRYVYSQT